MNFKHLAAPFALTAALAVAQPASAQYYTNTLTGLMSAAAQQNNVSALNQGNVSEKPGVCQGSHLPNSPQARACEQETKAMVILLGGAAAAFAVLIGRSAVRNRRDKRRLACALRREKRPLVL